MNSSSSKVLKIVSSTEVDYRRALWCCDCEAEVSEEDESMGWRTLDMLGDDSPDMYCTRCGYDNIVLVGVLHDEG